MSQRIFHKRKPMTIIFREMMSKIPFIKILPVVTGISQFFIYIPVVAGKREQTTGICMKHVENNRGRNYNLLNDISPFRFFWRQVQKFKQLLVSPVGNSRPC